MGASLAHVLQGSVQVSAAGSLSRKTGTKRRYSMINRRRVEAPPKRDKADLPSIESLVDGSHFKTTKTSDVAPVVPSGSSTEDDGNTQYFCCKSRCNTEWSAEALDRCRNQLERYGKGTQKARKTYVRGCISTETRQLHIRDGLNALPVCWRFYRALMGVSFNLIRSAGSLGGVGT